MADLGDMMRSFAQGATPVSEYFNKKRAYEQELLYGQQQEQQKFQQQMSLFAIKNALAQQAAGQRALDAWNRTVKREEMRGQTKEDLYKLKKPEREAKAAEVKARGEREERRVAAYEKSVEQAGKKKTGSTEEIDFMNKVLTFQLKQQDLSDKLKRLDPKHQAIYHEVAGTLGEESVEDFMIGLKDVANMSPKEQMTYKIKGMTEQIKMTGMAYDTAAVGQAMDDNNLTEAVSLIQEIDEPAILEFLFSEHGYLTFGPGVFDDYLALFPQGSLRQAEFNKLSKEQKAEYGAYKQKNK